MTVKWVTGQTQPVSMRSGLISGNIRLQVSETSDGKKQWQYMYIWTGLHSYASHAECLKTWPREAIELARKELDDLERALDEAGE